MTRLGGCLALLAVLCAGRAAAQEPAGPPVRLDGFNRPDGWQAAPSEGVALSLHPDTGRGGRVLRLDFDFQGHAGYAAIHKTFDRELPPNYAFSFWIRADAPVNNLEFKLIDSTGDNVWWRNQRNFAFPRTWTQVVIPLRRIGFAWGPRGGGTLRHLAALEIVVTAGTGGRGSVWLDDLTLEPRRPDRPYDLTPTVTASHSAPGHAPDLVLDGDSTTAWRSGTAARAETLTVDFLRRRTYGALVLDWEPGRAAGAYQVDASADGSQWQELRAVQGGNGGRDYLYLPESESRYLRLVLRQGSGAGYGLRTLAVKPLDWAGDLNAFFARVAQEEPRGLYPRYLTGEQSYWTMIGVSGDGHRPLLSEDGAIEPVAGGFSVEPMLYTGGRLLTWAAASASRSLQDGYLPIPSVRWAVDSLQLTVTAFAAGTPGASSAYARYRVENNSGREQRVTLDLAVRPFQVNPPWQFLGTPGGASRIDSLRWTGHELLVNGTPGVVPVTAPAEAGAASFDAGGIVAALRGGHLPSGNSVHDAFGSASAALAWPLRLPPGGSGEVVVRFPLGTSQPGPVVRDTAAVRRLQDSVAAGWREALNRVRFTLPDSLGELADQIRSNLAYMLINRDGPAIEPGSRSYRRSWIRDGAMIGDALLRLGHPAAVREFLAWFAPYQFASGKIPCCVDTRGADPVPENDSEGEFIYLVRDYLAATGDTGFVAGLWPHVRRASRYLDSLRQSRMTAPYRTSDSLAFFGLLPPSISHEGYSDKPAYSYWDDFFGLRGFEDAAALAASLGHAALHDSLAAIRRAFAGDLHRSIRRSMAMHRIPYVPGSADRGDFDPTSTSVGIATADALGLLPPDGVDSTYQRYWREVQTRAGGDSAWGAYTPYELRNVAAFLRLGWRRRALDLLAILEAGRRPAAWNQWPEVVWQDSTAPKFIGDLPHTWVGSDFVRAALDLFAYERDSTIVAGQGIPADWLGAAGGVAIHHLRIGRGELSWSMRRDQESAGRNGGGGTVVIQLSGTAPIPDGGVLVYAPIGFAAGSVEVDGKSAALEGDAVRVRRLPARVVFRKKDGRRTEGGREKDGKEDGSRADEGRVLPSSSRLLPVFFPSSSRPLPVLFPSSSCQALPCLVQVCPIAADDFAVEAGAGLGGTLLGGKVHVHQPETLGVALAPFVVVEQRPGEIPPEIHALPQCRQGRAEVIMVILHPQRIGHAAVPGFRRIVERGAVLGDVERQLAVAVLCPEQHPGESLGVDLPAGIGVDVPRLPHRGSADRPGSGLVPHHAAGVVVDPEEIDRLPDELEVCFGEVRPGVAEDLAHLRRIRPEQHRIEVLPVHVGVGPLGGREVFRRLRCRVLRFEVYHQADLVPACGAVGLHRGAVGAEQVVRRQRGLVPVGVARGEYPVQIAAIGHHPRLVERGPELHPVVQRPDNMGGIVREPAGNVAVEPAAPVVQRGGEVPVVQRDHRLDAVLQQPVHQPVVEGQACRIGRPPAGREEPAPGNAEAIGVEAQLRHQRDIALGQTVVIAGHVARLAVGRPARRMGKTVPDTGAGPVGQRRAFNLIGGGRGAPEKPGGNVRRFAHAGTEIPWRA